MAGKLKYRPDIEGLRGIGVLLVVLYHAGVPGFYGGFIGVDVFFVLSGYLITRLLIDEARSAGRIDLLAFYARRARRLLPAAALMVLTTLVAGWFVLSPLAQQQASQTALAAATYWSNFRFAFESGDYFGQDLGSDPLLHTWSLAVEEQFYVAWPLLVAAAVWLGRRRRGAVVAVLGAVTFASFAASLWVTGDAAHWAFFGPHARAWEFGVGALAGLASGRLRVPAPLFGAAVGWVGLGAVVASGMLLSEALAWPGSWALLPTLGTALVLASGVLAPRSRLQVALSARPLLVLGRLSYTWYLWHWPALVLAEAAWGSLSLPARLAVAAGSLGLSTLTHRLVENPIRFHPHLLDAPRRSFATMLILTLVVAGAASAATVFAGSSGDRQQRYIAAARDLPRSVADGCHLPVAAVSPARDCVYGDRDSSTVVVLVGDSHATQWFPAVERLAEERGWRLIVHAKSSCALVDAPVRLADGTPYSECDTWREAIMAELESLRPALVIASSYATYLAADLETWPEGLARALARLAASAEAIVYLRDTPKASFAAPECLSALLSKTGRGAGGCTFDREVALAEHAWEAEGLALAGVPAIDLKDAICPGPICSVEAGEMVFYRDSHHLTASFAASLADELGAALDAALGGTAQGPLVPTLH